MESSVDTKVMAEDYFTTDEMDMAETRAAGLPDP